MAVWEKATLDDGSDAGEKVHTDVAGELFIRILSPKFRGTDGGGDFGIIGYGMQIVLPPVEE